jgi:hypothetical protein
MKTRQVLLASLASLTIPAAAMAAGTSSVGYAYAQIYQANSTVQLVNASVGDTNLITNIGTLEGLKCLFPDSNGGAMVKIVITADAGKSSEQDLSLTVDPTYFQQESNGSGQFTSDWIQVPVSFLSTLLVQLNNTNLGTTTINCWASYSINPFPIE